MHIPFELRAKRVLFLLLLIWDKYVLPSQEILDLMINFCENEIVGVLLASYSTGQSKEFLTLKKQLA